MSAEIGGEKEIAVETRGMGLMRGLELSVPAGPYITKALEKASFL